MRSPAAVLVAKPQGLAGSWGTPVLVRAGLSPRSGRHLLAYHAGADVAGANVHCASPDDVRLSGLDPAASQVAVYASCRRLPAIHARLASGRWLSVTGRAYPPGPDEQFPSWPRHVILHSQA